MGRCNFSIQLPYFFRFDLIAQPDLLRIEASWLFGRFGPTDIFNWPVSAETTLCDFSVEADPALLVHLVNRRRIMKRLALFAFSVAVLLLPLDKVAIVL